MCWRTIQQVREKRLSLLGRAILLISGELLANTVCWIAAALTLNQAEGLLGLALLAWTIGLRHGLDADHISAIDNATRQLVSLGQLPITCGLWFSLGHSTIVIAVNIAIAISVDIYDKLDAVGSIGGLIGTSISASFLFLIACLNTFFLYGAIKERRRIKRLQNAGLSVNMGSGDEGRGNKIQGGGCLVRVIAPVLRAVDRPWKIYPVGILFGFGFDTASSIALLAISAIASRGTNGEEISHGRIVILPFLFTAGMSLVDSLDSVLMLYAYASPRITNNNGKYSIWSDDKPLSTLQISSDHTEEETTPVILDRDGDPEDITTEERANVQDEDIRKSKDLPTSIHQHSGVDEHVEERFDPAVDYRTRRMLDAKASTMSSLSISLTLLSILVALSISLIEIMGLIGDNCEACRASAEDPDGGGLAGSWWRAWAAANDQSGYIGAAIVGVFVAILAGYHGVRWVWKRYHSSKRKPAAEP